jgi:Ca2+-binding RTX toxin-like protein
VGATILAGGGDDTINGDGGNDNIDGGADNDTIDGGDGDDAIKGGLGNDTILVSEGNDIIDGGLGIDTMDFTPLDAFLNNDVDVNLNTGQATIKYLLQSDDIQQITNIENITTGGGDDSITGDAQDNVLDGGRGVDILDGGEGSDTYIFSGNFGHDTIVDTGTGNNSQSGGLNDIIAINGQSIGGEARYISDGVYELQIGLEKYQIKTSNGAAGGTLKIISESASNTITAENFTNGDFNISLQEKPTDVNPSSNLDDLLNSLSQAEATDPNQRIDPLVLDLNQNGFFRKKNANSVFRKNETFAESKISGASSLRLSEANEKRNEARFSKNSVLKNLKSNSNLKSFNKTLIQNFANDNSAIQHQKTARI